jgi:alginate O-acetyltransferase complex protein AlgI
LFPQLVAGPIVRYSEIENEIMNRTHTLLNFVNGTKRFCLGLAKKVLIANVLGEIADELFSMQTNEMYFVTSWFAIIAYSLQIYFDFSGYSDMGIGLGQVFGFKFPENFNFPYIAKSIKEFWRRWHMTLSRWFRDYLYIPLGGSHKGNYRTYFNLFLVFFATGLWHGATWNFVLWGLFHGLFLIIERLGFEKTLNKAPFLGHIYTLLVVVFAWVLFRIPELDVAMRFYKSMFQFQPTNSGLRFSDWIDLEYLIIFGIALILSMPVRTKIVALKSTIKSPIILEVWDYATSLFYLTLLFLSAMSIASSTYNPFIYFRF